MTHVAKINEEAGEEEEEEEEERGRELSSILSARGGGCPINENGLSPLLWYFHLFSFLLPPPAAGGEARVWLKPLWLKGPHGGLEEEEEEERRGGLDVPHCHCYVEN